MFFAIKYFCKKLCFRRGCEYTSEESVCWVFKIIYILGCFKRLYFHKPWWDEKPESQLKYQNNKTLKSKIKYRSIIKQYKN